MAKREKSAEVTNTELERQEGKPLPDREAMSLVVPGPDPIPLPFPVDDPDDWSHNPVKSD